MINLYQKVTDSVLLQLKNGTVPWVRPWSATAGRNVPQNAITHRPYSGVNAVLLWSAISHGYTHPFFLTFKQAQQLGGRVRRGQNGFKIYFVKKLDVPKKPDIQPLKDDDFRQVTMLREYTVFNVAQCDGSPDSISNPGPAKVRNKDERLDLADEFVRSLEADIRHGSEAYYAPGGDFICLPHWESFSNADAYYNTAFHELGHWTGHKHRLDRDLSKRFGTRAYAAEELVAELCAAFLAAEFAIDTVTRSAGYIDNWIQLLQHDNKAFFTAASRAYAAAAYLRDKALACPSSTSFVPLVSPKPPSSLHVN